MTCRNLLTRPGATVVGDSEIGAMQTSGLAPRPKCRAPSLGDPWCPWPAHWQRLRPLAIRRRAGGQAQAAGSSSSWDTGIWRKVTMGNSERRTRVAQAARPCLPVTTDLERAGLRFGPADSGDEFGLRRWPARPGNLKPSPAAARPWRRPRHRTRPYDAGVCGVL